VQKPVYCIIGATGLISKTVAPLLNCLRSKALLRRNNTSESVVENLQAVWPQRHFKLGKAVHFGFLKVHVTFWAIFA